MKKTLFILSMLLGSLMVQAQIFINKPNACVITFFSKTSIENISAKNDRVGSAINFKSDSITFKVQTNKFDFPNSLMEDHYNETYMESNKYPISIFKGKFDKHIDTSKPGVYPISCTGTLTMHGVTRTVTATGTITVKNANEITLHSSFNVLLKDYNIEIPTVVTNKIAESIQITVDGTYLKKK
jgi:polyisoprenoid-binding protein YceI